MENGKTVDVIYSKVNSHFVNTLLFKKLNMYKSLGGNDLTYRPFRFTLGWSMFLKMEPILTVLQVFWEKSTNFASI